VSRLESNILSMYQHGPEFKMRNIEPKDYPEVAQAATTVGKYLHDQTAKNLIFDLGMIKIEARPCCDIDAS
jgi:hypothetical protein